MKNKAHGSWVIFGMGNFINDIIDTIQINNDAISRIVINQPVDSSLIAKYKIELVSVDKFIPKQNEKYIFGFLNPKKEPFLKEINKHKIQFSNLIHPEAYISASVKLGTGNFIGAKVVVSPNTIIGNYNYLNRGVLIGHDVEIGSFNHFGPGSIVCGRCKILNGCNLGAGSVINDGLSICSDCITGSLAGVTKDITKAGTYVGLPAKRIVR